ncbi:hypothetical protein [Mesobacillus zeae]|uniref:Uncharacterized protein n=1 Tax=Mesobacillus zeae TaxID=1917180 RepID=A0A398BEW9_9BACI|nr:hypothetical protein [Mesobacillus zeae]RID87811.1 hypothetical protein D1970_02925 [Mesobacillus zeae]
MKIDWRAAFQIAAVYIGTVVGAGFATGREIVEFFSRFGLYGLGGILIAGYLLIFLGSQLLRVAAFIGASSYEQFNEYLFGKLFGRLINLLMFLMLIGVGAVMLSGAGAVFEEQLGMSKHTGVFITLLLTAAVMAVGMKGLFAVNVFVVPMMIIFSFILLYFSMQLPNVLSNVAKMSESAKWWEVIFSPVSYTAFNLSLAQAVLVPVAAEIKNDRTLKWGGILGGLGLTVILLSSHLTLVMLPEIEAYEIPMAVIMKDLAPGLYWVFLVIIYGEIFTSIIGNMFGLDRQIQGYVRVPRLLTVTAIFIVSYVISMVNYGTLLSYLYPIFGYISIIFVIFLWMKPLPAAGGRRK